MKKNNKRPIHKIAEDITKYWKNMSIYAKPYVLAMWCLHTLDDKYFEDSAMEIVTKFLSNAQHWRGNNARQIKKELNQMIKNYYDEII